jgi:serine protease AprX
MLLTSKSDNYDHLHFRHRHAVIPTSEKLNADPTFTGRGVTIAFLDSGFYPHPDVVDRVTAFHDIHGGENSVTEIVEPLGHHWHVTQTVVSCAGDGRLCDGIYRGLAYESHLVLIKVSGPAHLDDASIEQGLRWVIENRMRYGIRILNISLGGDYDIGLAENSINQLVEELVDSVVVVTVAAGNSDSTRSIPPASSPSAITVGGYTDQNQFGQSEFGLYHSSFGPTADGHIKPEIIAPAMYIAPPILPSTDDHRIAETLYILLTTPDYSFRERFERSFEIARLNPRILGLSNEGARRLIEAELMDRKILATHYQHVDGTSLAAPITASVAALMLEANPSLPPLIAKNILITTARRLGGHPTVRQGVGGRQRTIGRRTSLGRRTLLRPPQLLPASHRAK